ncbi:hypothetical protein Ocin01_04995 [Orchesella cincta]|uniref:Uncharacterized protein n=1 Tax=Orchesella cincta TaxID=48709 RepID=A0A1D2N8U4_ORCCI|nr:hypothetical protein Ocin01_04995 [Orchesella cincta]
MKATTVICIVLGVWVCGAYCSTQLEEDQSVVELAPEYNSAGHRAKRSPLDPIVAPLLIGKSFLYGALVGPKLFKPYYRPYYHHYTTQFTTTPRFITGIMVMVGLMGVTMGVFTDMDMAVKPVPNHIMLSNFINAG